MREARCTKARKFWAFFSYRVATRRSCFTFDQVSVLVSRPIGLSRRLRVRPAGHHGPAALVCHCHHDCWGVVPFFRDHGRERQALHQRLRLRHVGRLARGQNQPDRQPQSVHCGVDLGSEPAAAAAPLRIGLASGAVRFFWLLRRRGGLESRSNRGSATPHRGLATLPTPRARCPSSPSGRTASQRNSSGRNARASRATGHRFERSKARH